MSAHPTGTVTFLFTDIEGSTTLAQAHPAEWEVARQRHHAILRAAVEAHQGYVFQVVGDAMYAAFHNATDAIEASVSAQRALQTEAWDETPIRVRMGLHTGAAETRDGDYHGYLTLAQAQRVMSTAHGGQTLLSNATATLLPGHLPERVSLHDLGQHRLKGLPNPEHLWQIITPDLAKHFPPLQSLNTIPNNLPIQVTSFVGRERELKELQRLLTTSRLITLTGSGGTGKTRLSLQLAGEVLDQFHDGVWFVEFAPLVDASLVPQVVAHVLGLYEESGHPLLTTLTNWLHARQLIMILDNCEHLIEACARFADAVLHTTREVRIIVTSREVLGITGEQAYRVPSLGLPNVAMPLDTLTYVESIRLFVERARAVASDFDLTALNASAVAQVCRQLDGVPLAIELAAARVRMFSPEQIASRLDDRFRLLTGGSRSALPRQQTLRGAIDWSYNLLSEPERVLLPRLSVFASGWDFAAVESVCSDVRLPREDVLDLLTPLIDKSLVLSENRDGEVRYRLLETVRQYGQEKLRDAGETELVRDRHLDYFVGLAEEGERGMQGRDQVRWEKRLETEFDNLRVAMDWATDAPRTLYGLRLVGALWFFIQMRHAAEYFRRALNLLNKPDGRAPSVARAHALLGAYFPAIWTGNRDEGGRFASEALSIARSIDDRWAQGRALYNLADFSELPKAALLTEALAIAREIGDSFLEGDSLWRSAELKLATGAIAEAECDAMDSIAVLRASGEQHVLAGAERVMARILMYRGNPARALQHLYESMRLNRIVGEENGMARCLSLSAEMAIQRLDYAHAARLCGTILAWIDSRGLQLASLGNDRNGYERALATAQAYLKSADFGVLFAEGRHMSVYEAVGNALQATSGQ